MFFFKTILAEPQNSRHVWNKRWNLMQATLLKSRKRERGRKRKKVCFSLCRPTTNFLLGGLGVGIQQNGLFVIYFCGAGLKSKSADQNQKHLINCNNAFTIFAEVSRAFLRQNILILSSRLQNYVQNGAAKFAIWYLLNMGLKWRKNYSNRAFCLGGKVFNNTYYLPCIKGVCVFR